MDVHAIMDREWVVSEKPIELMVSTVRFRLEVRALQALGGCGALRGVVQEHVIQEASALFAQEWKLVAHVVIPATIQKHNYTCIQYKYT